MSHQDEFLYHRQCSVDNLLLYSVQLRLPLMNSAAFEQHTWKQTLQQFRKHEKKTTEMNQKILQLLSGTTLPQTLCFQNNDHPLPLIQNYFKISFSENKINLSSLHGGILIDFSFLFKSILFSWFTIPTPPCLRGNTLKTQQIFFYLLYFISRTAPFFSCLQLSCSLIPQHGCSFQLAQ